MKIGIRAHDLGLQKSAESLASLVASYGFDTVQLVLHKGIKNARHHAGELDREYARNIGEKFRAKGLEISLLGAYFDWFHDDEGIGYRKFCEHLRFALDFGTTMVGTEVQGIVNRQWQYNPENQTDEAYNKAKNVAQSLSSYAIQYGSRLTLEGVASHVLSTPERVAQLCDELPKNGIALIFDPVNFMTLDNYRNHRDLIDRTIDLYGERLQIVHCKDFIPAKGGLMPVALGKGLLDYPYLISRLKSLDREDLTLIFEDVTGEDIVSSFEYIKLLLKHHQ